MVHRFRILDFGFWIRGEDHLSSNSKVREPISIDDKDRRFWILDFGFSIARKAQLSWKSEIQGPISIDNKSRLNKVRNPKSKIQNPKSMVLLLAISAAGCQSFSSPLAQWRAAYDSNLYKKMTPDELADSAGPGDSTNLLQRWLKPSQNPSTVNGHKTPSSTLVLGSDGWRPIAKQAPDPEGRRGIPGRTQAVQAREVRRGREGIRQDRQEAQGEHVGRERTVLPGRVPVPAEEVCHGQRQLREAPRRLSRDRISPEADRPRVRVRPALARPDRSQGARRQEAALDVAFRRPAALGRHPGLRAQGARACPPE